MKRSKPDFDPRSDGASKLYQLVESLVDCFELKELRQNGSAKVLVYRAANVPEPPFSKPQEEMPVR